MNLSIFCVDGSTIYGMISYEKAELLKFLEEFDHEGSYISLVDTKGLDIVGGEKVYAFLREESK